MAKVLVVYFSRSGNTEKVARAIASALHADIEPIVDWTPRSGIVGYMRCALEATFRRRVRIEKGRHALASYDLVILGTPIWNASVSSPMREFITRHRKDLKNVAFFCTCGGRGAERVFDQMTEVSGKRPADVLVLREAELRRDHSKEIARFVRELRIVTEPVIAPTAP